MKVSASDEGIVIIKQYGSAHRRWRIWLRKKTTAVVAIIVGSLLQCPIRLYLQKRTAFGIAKLAAGANNACSGDFKEGGEEPYSVEPRSAPARLSVWLMGQISGTTIVLFFFLKTANPRNPGKPVPEPHKLLLMNKRGYHSVAALVHIPRDFCFLIMLTFCNETLDIHCCSRKKQGLKKSFKRITRRVLLLHFL